MTVAGPVVAVFATAGTDSHDADRARTLLAPLDPRPWNFDRSKKAASGLSILRRIIRERPAVVVMEGTGVAGGLAVIAGRCVAGVPFVVSTGDAVGPFIGLRTAWLGPLGGIYERLLMRTSSGVVGWTPYLVGRALTLGAPRAMTAPGWAPHARRPQEREAVRERYGFGADTLVVGIVGALEWSRRGYCYGLELVRALRQVDRQDLAVLLVGGGSGLARLCDEAGADLGHRIVVTGQVPRDQVPAHLAAMDVASLPQSLDKVGQFRYTTKLSEYVEAGLPVVTGRLPLAYDLDAGWLWRVAGAAPWSADYVRGLAAWMRTLDRSAVEQHSERTQDARALFDRDQQVKSACAFVRELLDDSVSPI